MFKVKDETTQSAFGVGIVAALVWGIGLSFYGLNQGGAQISWLAWSAQLIGGILACLLAPPAYVWGRHWVLARIHHQPRKTLRRHGA